MMNERAVDDGELQGSGGMVLELAVLEDASQQADVYWCNVLWQRQQPPFAPSRRLLERGDCCEIRSLEAMWQSWFDVLTSWEFGDALIGNDLRRLLDSGCATNALEEDFG